MSFTPGLKDTLVGTVTVTGPLTDAQLRASPVPITDSTTFYKPIVDESVTDTMYVGYADPGSSTASAVWRIRRFVTVASVMTATDADGNSNFDNVWDNRLILSYS